jgi:hypothetical protein
VKVVKPAVSVSLLPWHLYWFRIEVVFCMRALPLAASRIVLHWRPARQHLSFENPKRAEDGEANQRPQAEVAVFIGPMELTDRNLRTIEFRS